MIAASMGEACMPVSMFSKPPTLGANTAMFMACVMLVTVPSLRMPPAWTNPRSGRPSGTRLDASSEHETSLRRADTRAPLCQRRPRASSCPETRPLRPRSQTGDCSYVRSHSAVSMPSAPSPPDRMYSPPLRLPCGVHRFTTTLPMCFA